MLPLAGEVLVPVPLAVPLVPEPGALEPMVLVLALELGAAATVLSVLGGVGDTFALTLIEEVSLGAVVGVGVDPGVMEDDEATVLGVVEVAGMVVDAVEVLPSLVEGRLQPVTAVAASARTAMTGMSFFMTSPLGDGL